MVSSRAMCPVRSCTNTCTPCWNSAASGQLLPDAIALSIADDGPGIPAEERAAALRPFVRVGDAASKAGGSGLGLSLAAAVARLHGSRLTLGDNAPGLIVHCEFPKMGTLLDS